MTERKAVRGRTRRRLIAFAALGVLAAGALAGCRSEPGTAAFVGNTRITNSDVDSIVQHATDQDLQGCLGANGDPSACRREVLTGLVFSEIAHRYLSDHASDPQFSKDGDPIGDVQKAVEDAENSGQVNRDDAFQVGLATTNAYYRQMRFNLTPATPTEDQFHEMYDNARAQGVTDTYPDVKKQLQQLDGVGEGIAFQNILTGALKKYDVEISPRYMDAPVLGQNATAADKLSVPAVVYQDQNSGNGIVLTAVSLAGATSPAVVQLPSPAASGGSRP